MAWQAVLFDFDGVVVDTTRMKTEAFRQIYANQPAGLLEQIIAYHRQHGGISRLIKFAHFERVLLARTVDQRAIDALGARYAAMVRDKAVASPLIPGAAETLDELRARAIPAFVVSGTPQKELETIVAARKLGPWFREVHGSPPLKPVIIRDILKRHALNPARCLFLGDAPTDYDAATETGLHFLGIEPPGEQHLFAPDMPVCRRVHLPPAP